MDVPGCLQVERIFGGIGSMLFDWRIEIERTDMLIALFLLHFFICFTFLQYCWAEIKHLNEVTLIL